MDSQGEYDLVSVAYEGNDKYTIRYFAKGYRPKNGDDYDSISRGKSADFVQKLLKENEAVGIDNNHIHKELLDSEDKANMVDTDSIEFNYNDFGGVRVSFYYYDSNGNKDYFESNNIIAENEMEAVEMAMEQLNRLSGKTDRHGNNIFPVHFSEDEMSRVEYYVFDED